MEKMTKRYPRWQFVLCFALWAANCAALCWLVFGGRYGGLLRHMSGIVGAEIGVGIGLLLRMRMEHPPAAESGWRKRLNDAVIVFGGFGLLLFTAWQLHRAPLALFSWVCAADVFWITVCVIVPRWRDSDSPLLFCSLFAAQLVTLAAWLIVLQPLTLAQAEARVRAYGVQQVRCCGYCGARQNEYAFVTDTDERFWVNAIDGSVRIQTNENAA